MDTLKKNDGIKYLVFTPTEKNRETLKHYKKLLEESKRQIEAINDNEPIEYRKDFMKTRFESDDDLPLDKTFSISDMIIVAASVLEKNSKYYPQNFLHECAYKLNKCCNTKILMFQKELTLIKQVHQKNICFVFFKDVGFKFEPHVCNKCHDVLMTAYELEILQY